MSLDSMEVLMPVTETGNLKYEEMIKDLMIRL